MASKGSKGKPLRLRLEQLEERIAPAGAITVLVRDGSLLVTGDDLDNDVEIDSDGLLAGQYRVSSGSDATLINGQAGPIVFDGVTRDLNIKLADGNDQLLLDRLTVARNLHVDGGDGDNSASILFPSVTGNLRIKNGQGNQFIEIDGTIGNNLIIKNGMGNTEIDLIVGVYGNMLINNHEGVHDLDIDYSIVDGNLRIKTRSGNTDTDIKNLWVGGNLTIKNGTGTDILAMENTWVDGNVNINNGHGDTTTSMTDQNDLLGNVVIKNRSGNDQFLIDDSFVYGKFILNNGHGNSSTQITDSELGFLDLGSRVKLSNAVIRSGDGLDDLVVDGSLVGRNLNVNFGSGGSSSLVTESDFGGLKVRARNGSDLFDMEHSVVWGKTNINLGNDADQVFVDDSVLDATIINVGSGNDIVALDADTSVGFETPLRFFGMVKLIGGNGDDSFTLGVQSEAGASVVVYDTMLVNGGRDSDTLDYIGNGDVFFDSLRIANIETLI